MNKDQGQNLQDLTKYMRTIRDVLIFFLIITVLYLMRELSSLFIPVTLALFFAVLAQPLVLVFRKKLSLSVSIGLTIFTSVSMILLLGFVAYNSIRSFIANAANILRQLNTEVSEFYALINNLTGIELESGELMWNLTALLQEQWIMRFSGSFLNALGNATTFLLVTLLFFSFLVSTLARFRKFMGYAVGGDQAEQVEWFETTDRIRHSMSVYIKVKTIVSFFTGVGIGIVCLAFGIQNALLWAFFGFILNYIPYIGSAVAILFPFLLGIIKYQTFLPVFLLLVALLFVQALMANVIEPKLQGRSLSINVITILLGLFFWAYMWGAVGMLLAVPLTFMIKVILEHVPDAAWLVRLMDKKA